MATAVRVPPPGLSGKLLVLTILFVMIAEVLIYVPSIANFRMNWLHDRLAVAYTAALVFTAAEGASRGAGCRKARRARFSTASAPRPSP